MGKGKRKRGWPSLNELLEKPFCYYCEREFEDLRVLMSHQKAKHFKCEKCGRRLNTAGGLSVHMNQVHKENLESVDNALPNRSDLTVEIFGMEGIPEEIVAEHKRRVVEDYYRKAQEHLKKTGNVPRGVDMERPNKRPKMETREEIRKRFDEWRAQKKREREGVIDATPNGKHEHPLVVLPIHEKHKSENVLLTSEKQNQHQAHSPPNSNQQGYPQPPFNPPGQFPQQQTSGYEQVPPGQQYPPGVPQYAQTGYHHYGHGPSSASPALGSAYNQQNQQQQPPTQDPRLRASSANYQQINDPRRQEQTSANASSVDDLIANAARESESNKAAANEPGADKKSKKDKDKASVLVYSEADNSFEESMSHLNGYIFDRNQEPEDMVLGDAVQATTVGAAVGDGPLNEE